MIITKRQAQNLLLLGFLSFFITFQSNAQAGAAEGKQLFQQNCQTCHSLDKTLTGPALRGFTSRGPWGDKEIFMPGSKILLPLWRRTSIPRV